MIGYLVRTAVDGGATIEEFPCRVNIPGYELRVVYRRAATEVSVWGGSTDGEVHVFENGAGDLLIFQGYLTAAAGITSFKKPGDIAQKLESCIQSCPTLQDLSSFAATLNGGFAILHIDVRNDRVRTITDRVGSRRIWRTKTANTQNFSSHALVAAQAASQLDLDVPTLTSTLLYSASMVPERGLMSGTDAQGVATVEESSCLGEHQSCIVYYKYRHRPDPTLSRAEWVKEIAGRFTTAAGRLLGSDETALLFLSGGVDSRLAAAAVASSGSKADCITLCDSVNLEATVATKVAVALDFPHQLYERDRHYYLRNLRNSIFSSGGCYRWRHGHFAEAFRKSREEGPETYAILGDLGEAFSKLLCNTRLLEGRLMSSSEFVESFDALPLTAYRPDDRARTLGVLTRSAAEYGVEQLNAQIARRYEKTVEMAQDPMIVADLFFRWADISAQPTFQMFLDVRSVGGERNLMFDNEVHQVLEMLPSSERNSTGLGGALVRALHPAAAGVVDANTLLPLSYPRWMHHFAKRARPFFGKVKRTFASNTYQTTGSWSLLTLLYSSDKKWREEFEYYLLNEDFFDDAIFDRAEIKRAWLRFLDGDLSVYQDLEKLLSLGVIAELCRK